jgi:protease-4
MPVLPGLGTRSALPARLRLAAGFSLAVLAAAPAQAQQGPRLSDGVTTPWYGVASTDDSNAVYVNPANLPFAAGPEARLAVLYTGEDAPIALRGYALGAAVPFWIFGTGLRLDFMDPPDAAPPPFAIDGDGKRYGWVRWSTGVNLGDFAGLGTTLAWSHGQAAQLHDHFSVASALTVRPNRFVSAAVVARDWNSPENDAGTEIEPSVDLGASFRPVNGRRVLEIGLEGSYRSDGDHWVPSANVAVDIPYVGRFRGGVQMLDPSDGQVVATAGLDINFDNLQVTGGAVFGNAVTAEGTGFVAGVAIRSFRERPGIPMPARVVRMRFESTPNVLRHGRILQAMWKMAEDPEVDGVVLVLRADPAPSLAHAEELVDAIQLMRRNGKKVMCHLEDASARELFVCAAADRIAINPAGGLRFAGLASRYLYFGGLLDKLGVRADFVRIGAHKTAPEQFTAGPTEVALGDHQDLLDNYEKIYLRTVAKGRKMKRATAKAKIAKGPFIAPEARDAGFVDQLVYEDELDRYAADLFGGPVRVRDLDIPDEPPEYWRSPPKIALVYLYGDMIDGNSRHIPIIDIQLAGSYTIAAALKAAREDKSVKAVVFRIETGGGSSLASDVILREAQLTAKAKPLIVSMGGKAASGGYYASVAGNEIFANRATVTGSIGIFYGKVDVVGLLDKLGVKSVALRTAPKADAESFFRPFSDSERMELGRKVKQFYDLFVGRVAEGRKMTPAEVHAVAQGRVWTGEQAKKRGLVDHIGGLRQALARARELADLPDDAPITTLPAAEQTLLDIVLDLVGIPTFGQAEAAWVPPPLTDMVRALIPFTVFEPGRPLALLELMYHEP